MVESLRPGKTLRTAKYTEQAQALAAVAAAETLGPVLSALQAIRQIPGAQFVRRELFYEMCRSLEAYASGGYESLEAAAWEVRNRTSRTGRRYGRVIVSRTLLIKGLEFDHAIVLDADAMDARDLNVAMTRGTRTLTILSKSPVLHPRLPQENIPVVQRDHAFTLLPG